MVEPSGWLVPRGMTYGSCFRLLFFLFGEDYPKYKAYMTEGWFLYAQCRVQERKWGDGELELKLVSLEMLSEIKEKKIRSVTASISLSNLNSNIINSIIDLSKQFPGKHNLKFIIYDEEEDYKVPLRSKKIKINLDYNFIIKLKQIPFLEIKIN